MSNDDTSRGNARCDFRKSLGNELVLQTVKAIATDTFGKQMIRDSKPVGDFRMPAVKRGIKARDLKNAGPTLQKRLYRGEIVRLVQGGERDKPSQLLNDMLVDNHRLIEIWATVHDAVADRFWQVGADVLTKKCDDPFQSRWQVANFDRLPAFINEQTAVAVFDYQAGAYANSVYLSAHPPLKLVVFRYGKQLKLDARAARVHNENGFCHGYALRVSLLVCGDAREE